MLASAKVDAIVQARMGSTRLPAKILAPITGRPLLMRVVDRLRACTLVERVIIATTTAASDDEVVEFCDAEGVLCHRGEVDQVLQRFLGACDAFGCERILRVCGDNPFLDPHLMTEQIAAFGPDVDYCTFATRQGEPLILKPVGIFAEAVTRLALETVARLAQEPIFAEHVTMYIYRHPERFRILTLPIPDYVDPDRRLTVDYPEDIRFCEYILSKMNDPDTFQIMKLIEDDPALAKTMDAFSSTHKKSYVIPTK